MISGLIVTIVSVIGAILNHHVSSIGKQNKVRSDNNASISTSYIPICECCFSHTHVLQGIYSVSNTARSYRTASTLVSRLQGLS